MIFTFFIAGMAIELLAFFVTTEVKSGNKLSKQILKSDYEYNYKIDFKSGEFKDV